MAALVSLSCPNCGGALKVDKSVTEFVCGYCDSTLLASMEGGAFFLKIVEKGIEDIKEKQVATGAAIKALSQKPKVEEQIKSRILKLREDKARESECFHVVLVREVICAISGLISVVLVIGAIWDFTFVYLAGISVPACLWALVSRAHNKGKLMAAKASVEESEKVLESKRAQLKKIEQTIDDAGK